MGGRDGDVVIGSSFRFDNVCRKIVGESSWKTCCTAGEASYSSVGSEDELAIWWLSGFISMLIVE